MSDSSSFSDRSSSLSSTSAREYQRYLDSRSGSFTPPDSRSRHRLRDAARYRAGFVRRFRYPPSPNLSPKNHRNIDDPDFLNEHGKPRYESGSLGETVGESDDGEGDILRSMFNKREEISPSSINVNLRTKNEPSCPKSFPPRKSVKLRSFGDRVSSIEMSMLTRYMIVSLINIYIYHLIVSWLSK